MARKVRPIPKGHGSVAPYVIVEGAAKAIAYYKKAFGAEEVLRLPSMDRKSIMHAEIKIGNSMVMLADACPEMGAKGPGSFKGSPITLHLYVEDVDKVFNKAVKAGGTVKRPVADQFYGDRSGMVEDPFGHVWNLSTHIQDMTPDQIKQAAKAAFGAPGKKS